MGDEHHLWVGSIVIDCRDLPRMMTFWQAALHYVPRDPPEDDGVVLKDPEGIGPNVSLYRTDDGPLEEYRLHLDLYSNDPGREVERLCRLGAVVKRPADDDHDFVTLADPDGNLFDVVKKPGWKLGQRTER